MTTERGQFLLYNDVIACLKAAKRGTSQAIDTFGKAAVPQSTLIYDAVGAIEETIESLPTYDVDTHGRLINRDGRAPR